VCGGPQVARPKTPIKFGNQIRGGMCPRCHTEWEALTVNGRRMLGLFVARRLFANGRLPKDYPLDKSGHGVHPVQSYPETWRTFVWAVRVLRSDRPELQQPPTELFGYLAPGPMVMAEVWVFE
jgi:hypothetical protein